MIQGSFDDNLSPSIELSVHGSRGRMEPVTAIVDTGFNGCLTLPPSVIAALGLRRYSQGRATLADGSDVLFDVYEGTVLLDGQERITEIESAELGCLLGMELLRGFDLWFRVTEGGPLTITQTAMAEGES